MKASKLNNQKNTDNNLTNMRTSELDNQKNTDNNLFVFGTEQVYLLLFDSQVIQVLSSSQCSVQGLLKCLLLGIV